MLCFFKWGLDACTGVDHDEAEDFMCDFCVKDCSFCKKTVFGFAPCIILYTYLPLCIVQGIFTLFTYFA